MRTNFRDLFSHLLLLLLCWSHTMHAFNNYVCLIDRLYFDDYCMENLCCCCLLFLSSRNNEKLFNVESEQKQCKKREKYIKKKIVQTMNMKHETVTITKIDLELKREI